MTQSAFVFSGQLVTDNMVSFYPDNAGSVRTATCNRKSRPFYKVPTEQKVKDTLVVKVTMQMN
jgi:hypothetical protein